MSKDELRHIIVGDPDPTAGLPGKGLPGKGLPGNGLPGNGNGHTDDCRCGFEWTEQASRTLTLLWLCTREPGHPGQHLAGTGESVAAVHPGTHNDQASGYLWDRLPPTLLLG